MNNQTVKHRTICTAITRLGNPCRSWAIPGTDPPRCASHGGVPGRPGAPLGNQNAVTHGLYAKNWKLAGASDIPELRELDALTNDAVISGEGQQAIVLVTKSLMQKYLRLSHYIDQQAEELPLVTLSHLLSLHAQMASRLGRLFRDQRILAPEQDGISLAIQQAMVELSEILGTDLT